MVKIWRVCLVFLLLGCASSYASTSSSTPWWKVTDGDQFTGPYVGAELGANVTSIHDTNEIVTSLIHGASGSATYTENATGVEGGLFVGYGKRLPYHLYLGSEVYAMLNSASATATNNPNTDNPIENPDASVKYRMLGTFGVNFDPGVFLTPNTLFYGTAGPTFALFNSVPQTQDTALVGSNNSFTRVLPGARFGLGIETAIYRNLNIRGEYDFSVFPEFNDSYYSRSSLGENNARYYALSNEALLSVVYHI